MRLQGGDDDAYVQVCHLHKLLIAEGKCVEWVGGRMEEREAAGVGGNEGKGSCKEERLGQQVKKSSEEMMM